MRGLQGAVNRLVLARGADVGELLGLHGIHDEIVVAAVRSHDHAFVKRLAGVHEHAAALLAASSA